MTETRAPYETLRNPYHRCELCGHTGPNVGPGYFRPDMPDQPDKLIHSCNDAAGCQRRRDHNPLAKHSIEYDRCGNALIGRWW